MLLLNFLIVCVNSIHWETGFFQVNIKWSDYRSQAYVHFPQIIHRSQSYTRSSFFFHSIVNAQWTIWIMAVHRLTQTPSTNPVLYSLQLQNQRQLKNSFQNPSRAMYEIALRSESDM